MKIFAFVVTYNRLELLKNTIECLRNQTQIIDSLFVVNNGSTDGTFEWLSSQKDLYLINQENVGGAGGFHTGVKYAFNENADWIWMMDDDVFPNFDALEKLLLYKDVSGCLMPTRYYSDGIRCNWGYIYDLKKRSIVFGTRPSEQGFNKPFTVINTGCFEGMLISKQVVEKIGFPDARFFISGDDTIYGLLASKFTNVLLIEQAILIRAKKYSDSKFDSPLFLYYLYRNFHLFEEYYCKLSGKKKYSLQVKMKEFYGLYRRLLEGYKNKSNVIKILKAILYGMYDSRQKKIGKSDTF